MTVNIKDFKKEQRKRDIKNKIRSMYLDVECFISNNKEFLIVALPAVASLSTVVCKTVNKRINNKKEQDLKELYCYDRSLGHYWKLRRELTNSEWIEIDKRKNNGERLSDILESLKVLK